MKVRCIKNRIGKPNREFNYDMSDLMKVGSEFIIYGIKFNKNVVEVYIFINEHLTPVPLELFEIVDDKVPNIWKCRIGKYGAVTLFPELFYEEWFLDNFSDFQKEERERFKELQEIIEQ